MAAPFRLESVLLHRRRIRLLQYAAQSLIFSKKKKMISHANNGAHALVLCGLKLFAIQFCDWRGNSLYCSEKMQWKLFSLKRCLQWCDLFDVKLSLHYLGTCFIRFFTALLCMLSFKAYYQTVKRNLNSLKLNLTLLQSFHNKKKTKQ